MPRFAVRDIADERLAAYRNVKDGDLRRAHGLFMAEGRLVVEQLLDDSRFTADSVFLSERMAGAMASFVEAHPDVPVYVAKSSVMNEVVGFDLHRGCLAAGRIGEPLAASDVISAGLPDPGATFVIAEGMTNTENMGAVFRNAVAFGARGVLLCPRSCDPLYRKAIRVSLGASLRLPFARVADWPGGLDALRQRGGRIVALDPGSAAIDLSELEATLSADEPVGLLLGTEGGGLSDGARARADLRVRIPMMPGVDSVNVATAAAIALQCLYERAQRPGRVTRESGE
ncbi:MAG: RNA methyltransferase [Myxococcota bacterium]|jgi:tRNA G18 (ribose-2'-O)-methylase SpoU|nr:RNA methyltransferase [Myxococcota bacterium]